jgi:hypothetical protein
MRRFLPLILFSIFLGGCAAYKELSPKPELSPAERGYIELKDNDENFKLDKDGKYFIRFPKPANDQFALVLRLNAKSTLRYYLTDRFDDGKGEIHRIKDESAGQDTISAYFVNTSVPEYFWVIDSVLNDANLAMTYRYMPQWRFTFENKYAEYKQILEDNTVERTTYNSIDNDFSFSNFPFSEQLSRVQARTKNIRVMKGELTKLEKVFPPNIASTRDTAYQNFISLRDQTNDELRFQENYANVISVFKKEHDSHGNIAKFLESAPAFTEFLSQRERYREPIVDRARQIFLGRLKDVPEYYENQLRTKNDSKKITFATSPENVGKLYEALGAVPPDFKTMMEFVDRFNMEASAMQSVNDRFNQIDKAFGANPPWFADAFYEDLMVKITEIKSKLPESKTLTFEKYGRYPSATMLDAEIRNATERATASETLFGMAQRFILQIGSKAWPEAEGTLKEIHSNGAFTAIPAVNDEKTKFVKAFEVEFFSRVKQLSQERVDAFVKANEAAIDNVPALYRDSAFVPAYDITFSSAGESDVQRKRAEIQTYIDKLKYNDFPAASIKAIYRDFTRNINDRGVDRARAIMEHGKFYKGDDKQLRSMVNEVDPMIAKWIIKPKEYRKQYVLPVTTNPRGVNEYVFRVLLKIPSEAQFPVFEINIKLPKEVAEKAGTQSWYQSIKINKTLIKNEGRYTITAPSASNEYESQVAPVQMDKAGNNVLEVRFKYPGYKVFEVSTMAQVPIIRKN